eukprot:6893837-Pyramimonas_sp.AAC.1
MLLYRKVEVLTVSTSCVEAPVAWPLGASSGCSAAAPSQELAVPPDAPAGCAAAAGFAVGFAPAAGPPAAP